MQEADVRPHVRAAFFQAAALRTVIASACGAAHPDDPTTTQLFALRHRLVAVLDDIAALHTALMGEELQPCPLSASDAARDLAAARQLQLRSRAPSASPGAPPPSSSSGQRMLVSPAA